MDNTFYAIKGVFGKAELFLCADEERTFGYRWGKKSDAIWWEHREDAETFSNSYFKNFTDWEIVEVYAEV